MIAAIVRGVVGLAGAAGVRLSPFWAGAALAGVLALLLSIGGGLTARHLYRAGYAAADSAWREKALEAQIATLKADRDAARAALADASLRAASIEDQAIREKEGTAAYVEELKKSFSAACALNDGDVGWLRKRAGAGAGRDRARAAGSARPGAAPGGASILRRWGRSKGAPG